MYLFVNIAAYMFRVKKSGHANVTHALEMQVGFPREK
jgi:hypothetical protein